MDTARGSDRIERWLGLYQKNKTMKIHTHIGYGFFAFTREKGRKVTKIKVTFWTNLLGK